MSDLVSINDIAERLGVQVGTVYQWRQRNLLPEPDVMVKPAVWTWETIEEWARQTRRLPQL